MRICSTTHGHRAHIPQGRLPLGCTQSMRVAAPQYYMGVDPGGQACEEAEFLPSQQTNDQRP